MHEPYADLPFDLNQTYSQDVLTPTSTMGMDVVGRRYKITNPADPSTPLVLVAVRYVGSSPLTAAAKVVQFVAGQTGVAFDGYLGTNGGTGKPLVPQLAGKTIQPNDIVYVVDDGLVELAKATGSSITAGQVVFANNQGLISGAVTSGYPIGIAAASAGNDATTVKVRVLGGFRT